MTPCATRALASSDLAFGIDHPLQQSVPAVCLLIGFSHGPQRIEDFPDSLMEFRLVGVFLHHSLKDFINIGHTVTSLQKNKGVFHGRSRSCSTKDAFAFTPCIVLLHFDLVNPFLKFFSPILHF